MRARVIPAAALRLWTLIHKPRKPATPQQKAARKLSAKKAAKTRAANRKKKPGAKAPAPRSGAPHKPRKAASPRPATHAA
jgi:hypothetical protein